MSLFVLLNGKTGSFLIVNGQYNPVLDFVCKWWTYMGDGIMWVPLCLYCIVWKRDFFWTTIVAIIISTLITHLFKDIIFPGELRPIHLLSQNIPVHTVPGVKMNTVHSFPSGHTAQAFTMALLLTYMINKRYCAYILPLLALGVAYSRVYLAQHFVTDVLAGSVVGVISAWLTLLFHKKIVLPHMKKKELKSVNSV